MGFFVRNAVYSSTPRPRVHAKPHTRGTALQVSGLRLYEPGLARWISRDPLEEEGASSLYAFVNNRVIDILDPVGLEAFVLVKDPTEKKTYASADDVMKDADYTKEINGGGITETELPKVITKPREEPGKWIEQPGRRWWQPPRKIQCYESIVFRTKVSIDKRLVDEPENLVWVSYSPHVTGGKDGMAVIRGYLTDKIVIAQGAPKKIVEQHEKGHVQALFDLVADMEKYLEGVKGQEVAGQAKVLVAQAVTWSSLPAYDKKSGDMANTYTYKALEDGKWKKVKDAKKEKDYDPRGYGDLFGK